MDNIFTNASSISRREPPALRAPRGNRRHRTFATGCVAILLLAISVAASAQEVVTTISLSGFNNAGSVAVNPNTNRIYVGGSMVAQFVSESAIAVIDGGTNTVLTKVAVTTSGMPTSDVAVDPGLNQIYATDGQKNVLVVIDGATNAILASIPVGKSAGHIAVNKTTHRVYVAGNSDGSIAIIDGSTNTLVTTLGGIAGSGTPSGISLAIDESVNRVYFGGVSPGTVTAIDGTTNAIIQTVPTIDTLVTVAVNPVTHKVYAGNFQKLNVTAIDTSSFSTTNVPAGRAIYALSVDPVTNRIYVANAGDGNVTVIDGSTDGAVATVPTGSLPHAVAVNTQTNEIFVPSRTSNNVTVIEGSNDTTTTLPAGAFADHVAVDETTNRIYVSNANANSVTVIKGGDGPPPVDVVEYYNAGLDHYFITWVPDEIATLDAGTRIKGWTRTGLGFKTYSSARAGTSDICRFYIPPAEGDSHFFGRGTVECNATGAAHPDFVLEDPKFMAMFLPNAGVCPANTTEVHRVFSNRPDANHRYMTDPAIEAQMVAKGWVAEGDGPDLVVMCAPQ
jgi:YVTN family beta-propeller protein